MRSALYYPYTSIQSEDLLRTSLLLWDRVYTIAPWKGYHSEPPGNTKAQSEAHELIVERRVPSDEDKYRAHEFITDFAMRPLPKPFFFKSRTDHDDWEVEMFSQKLLPRTWEMLAKASMAVSRGRGRLSAPRSTALSILSILADCCAGESLGRITDQGAAYGKLAGLLAEEPEDKLQAETDALAAVTLRIINTRNVPLSKLVSFRKREGKSARGHELRALRHRYVDRLSMQASQLVRIERARDRAELTRQFEQDMADDLAELRAELRLAATEVLTSKELLAVVLVEAAAVAASPFFHFRLSNVVSMSGGLAFIGGLLASRTKFVKARRDLLRNHPMAYLYELKGGIRI
jgi:hypothetical protein